jgi:hypothetical protein
VSSKTDFHVVAHTPSTHHHTHRHTTLSQSDCRIFLSYRIRRRSFFGLPPQVFGCGSSFFASPVSLAAACCPSQPFFPRAAGYPLPICYPCLPFFMMSATTNKTHQQVKSSFSFYSSPFPIFRDILVYFGNMTTLTFLPNI